MVIQQSYRVRTRPWEQLNSIIQQVRGPRQNNDCRLSSGRLLYRKAFRYKRRNSSARYVGNNPLDKEVVRPREDGLGNLTK